MDIPNDVLLKLKCSGCGVYLSRGPVYLQHDGAALCGQCFTPDLPATRNTQFEAVAPLLRFPCKYSELGCGDTVPYVQEDEVIAHEEMCPHRQWVCPVLGAARCDWLGHRMDLLQHCQDRHPDLVLDNPCHLEHDNTTSSDRTFLLRAFHLLFLLHTKVCVASDKIYYAVRHLGSSDDAADFTYNLDIRRNDQSISRKGQVAPQGCLAIQEDTSLALDFNTLVSLLGGFAGASFIVEVKQRLRQVVGLCTGCETQFAVLLYRGEGGWKCERCAPARQVCLNQGCSYRDIDVKCVKHWMYFCQQRTKCRVCGADVARGSMSAHFDSACRGKSRLGSTWRATRQQGRQYLLPGAAGNAVCIYWLDDTVFDLFVYIPVTYERLREFRCVVRVSQSTTGKERIYTPAQLYNQDHDWHIRVERGEFPRWTGFSVSVEISDVQN